MILYLIKSVIVLSVCLGIYLAFLEREKMHRFNRAFLVGAIILGFVVPFLSFEVYIPSPKLDNGFHSAKESLQDQIEVPAEYVLNSVGVPIASALDESRTRNIYTRKSQFKNASKGIQILLVVYFAGAGFFFIRFIAGLYNMYRQVLEGEKLEYQSATLVLLQGKVIPHSFLNYIFVSKQAYEEGNIPDEILTHELTHVKQYHTIDVFFLELIKVVYWFNPVVYFFEKPVKINHEFLADQAVIHSDVDASQYQQVLLGSVARVSTSPLASTLTYSLTKKRLMMMVKKSSKRVLALKTLLLLPAMASVVLFLSEEQGYTPRSVLGNDYAASYSIRHYADVILNAKVIVDPEDGPRRNASIYDNDGKLYTGEQNWYEKGSDMLVKQNVYENGKLTETRWLDESARITTRHNFKNGFLVETFMKHTTGTTKTWNTHEGGKWVKFESIHETDTSKTRMVSLFGDEGSQGSSKIYRITEEGEYLELSSQEIDSVTTLYKGYFPNGQLKEESTMYYKVRSGVVPKRHGLHTEYNEQGKIVLQVRYEHGEIVEKIK